MISIRTIDSGVPGPSGLIIAGVHGDEFEPILATRVLLNQLEGKLTSGKLTVIPTANSSAVQQHTRLGSDDLDLARICPGNMAGSISDQDAAAVSALIKTADFLIDLHTGGRNFQIYPMVGYMIHPEITILKQQRKMAEAFGLPLIWGTDSAPNGRTLSVARDIPIPSLYAEYGGGASVDSAITSAYVRGCMNVLKLYNMLPGSIFSNEPEYWVEDPRSNQGHLQIKMPAPVSGIFVPAVKLGQWIEAGQLWGHIMDMQSGIATKVISDDTGRVLFLRSDAIVQQNDSLGGVISASYLINIKS